MSDFDLTPPQLKALQSAPAESYQTAKSIGSSPMALKALIRKGLMRSRLDERPYSHRRVTVYQLTEEGAIYRDSLISSWC